MLFCHALLSWSIMVFCHGFLSWFFVMVFCHAQVIIGRPGSFPSHFRRTTAVTLSACTPRSLTLSAISPHNCKLYIINCSLESCCGVSATIVGALFLRNNQFREF